MGSDGNGWTLNSIGYNRGFTDVLKKLMSGEKGWEDELPEGIAEIIKEKHLFSQKELPEGETPEKKKEKEKA